MIEGSCFKIAPAIDGITFKIAERIFVTASKSCGNAAVKPSISALAMSDATAAILEAFCANDSASLTTIPVTDCNRLGSALLKPLIKFRIISIPHSTSCGKSSNSLSTMLSTMSTTLSTILSIAVGSPFTNDDKSVVPAFISSGSISSSVLMMLSTTDGNTSIIEIMMFGKAFAIAFITCVTLSKILGVSAMIASPMLLNTSGIASTSISNRSGKADTRLVITSVMQFRSSGAMSMIISRIC